jgi:hypothetical protein
MNARHLALRPTCLATVALLTGCGGSNQAGAGTPAMRAKAVLFAHAVNMRAGDVPNAKTTAREREVAATPEPVRKPSAKEKFPTGVSR